MEDLVAYLQAGERKIDRWTARHRVAVVEFEDAAAFFNANTMAELQQLQQQTQTPKPAQASQPPHDR